MRKVFLTTLLVIMMSAATAMAAGWEQIYTDENDNQIFFDPAQVSVISHFDGNAEFTAKFRLDYSDRGRQAMIDWYRDYSIMPKDIQSLSYDVATIHFKKVGDRREYYVAERVSYTANGTSLADMHFVNNNPTFEEIPISSLVEVEYYTALLIVEGKDFN